MRIWTKAFTDFHFSSCVIVLLNSSIINKKGMFFRIIHSWSYVLNSSSLFAFTSTAIAFMQNYSYSSQCQCMQNTLLEVKECTSVTSNITSLCVSTHASALTFSCRVKTLTEKASEWSLLASIFQCKRKLLFGKREKGRRRHRRNGRKREERWMQGVQQGK